MKYLSKYVDLNPIKNHQTYENYHCLWSLIGCLIKINHIFSKTFKTQFNLFWTVPLTTRYWNNRSKRLEISYNQSFIEIKYISFVTWYIYNLTLFLIVEQERVNWSMDYNLLFLMLAACFCGSIKNSLNLPDEFEGRLAKPVTHNRQYPKYLPHWMKKYQIIDGSGTNDIKGNNMYHMIMTNSQPLFLYLHSRPIVLLEYLFL